MQLGVLYSCLWRLHLTTGLPPRCLWPTLLKVDLSCLRLSKPTPEGVGGDDENNHVGICTVPLSEQTCLVCLTFIVVELVAAAHRFRFQKLSEIEVSINESITAVDSTYSKQELSEEQNVTLW